MTSINKKFITIGVIAFLVGWFGGFSIGSSSESREDKISLQEEKTANLQRQEKDQKTIQACRSTIEINTQALGLAGEMLSLSGEAPMMVFNDDADGIEEITRKIEAKTEDLNKLKDQVEPIAKECWKD